MANGKSDGSVIIDTRIDTSGFSKGMADAKQKVSAFSGSLNKLGNTIKNTFSQSNTVNIGKSYDELRKEIAKAESQLDKLIEKQIRFVETGGNIKSRAMAGMEYDIEMARNRLEELRSQLSLTSKETPKKVGKMKTWIESLKKSFNSLDKSTRRSHYSILKMLGTSILFSTVFRAISAVTKGFGEGINNLVQYSDKANVTMSALKSSLTQLKNSFATAFMPIITAVTPAITQFMALISKATSILAAFLSALTGNKTYTKAIEVQEDYAASLDKTADSAKKAQKYLSGLDEIRTFTEKDSGTSGVALPENMFTEEEIDSPILDFADKVKAVIDKIKTFIKNEDWEGLGSYISDGIVGALDFLSEKIDEFDWESLGEDIGEFIKGIEWTKILQSVGKLIWEAITAGIEFWKGMFDAAPIETTILTALLGMKLLGITIPVPIMLALSVIGFAPNIAQGIAEKLGITETIFGDPVEELDWGYFFEKLQEGFTNEAGKFSIKAGIEFTLEVLKANVIGTAELLGLSNSENPLVRFLFSPTEDIIKEIEEKFKKLGKKLKSGFNDTIKKAKEFFSKEKWTDAMKGVKEAFDSTWKGAVNAAIELLNKFIDYLNDKMHFEWEPFKVLGKEIIPGGNVQLFTIPKIPMLATGAVIPPNAPFMAMLGDQKHGNNLEMPEDLLRKVVREESGNGNGGGNVLHNVVQINRRTLLEEMIEEAKLRQSTSGRNPFDLA